MYEKELEKILKDGIERQRGMLIKAAPVSLLGLPDRIALVPMGRVYFIELKSEYKKGKVSPIQQSVHSMLEKIGFHVYVLQNIGDINWFLTKLRQGAI